MTETTTARAGPWTPARKRDFLAFLAATCDVAAAAGHVGVAPGDVFAVRARDGRFRARWAEALEQGYQMLETQLVGHALAGGGPKLCNGDTALTGPIDVALAQALLLQHDARRRATPADPKATAEQTNQSILRKLRAMQRAAERGR